MKDTIVFYPNSKIYVIKCIIYILSIVFFAWATYYFIKKLIYGGNVTEYIVSVFLILYIPIMLFLGLQLLTYRIKIKGTCIISPIPNLSSKLFKFKFFKKQVIDLKFIESKGISKLNLSSYEKSRGGWGAVEPFKYLTISYKENELVYIDVIYYTNKQLEKIFDTINKITNQEITI